MTVTTSKGDVILFALSVIGLIWYVVLWSIGILGCRTARRRYLRPWSPLAPVPASSAPGVSILRPLKGLDTNLYENLESTFVQEYPNFEILLSVAYEHDQALSVVRELTEKYPDVDVKVVIGEDVVGVNPKVNNLIRSYRQAANDILWVIDSNVAVDSGTLARSVDVLVGPPPNSQSSHRKRVALVHHVPLANANEAWLGARVEEAFLNTNHAKMYLAINTVAIESCVVGKSNLYRRSDIDRVNGLLKPKSTPDGASQTADFGLAAFGRFLAEDNMIASSLWHELGLRHDLSCDVAHNAVGKMTLSDYIWRRVRWIRVRKHMVLAATILEPLTENFVASSIAAWSLWYLTGVPAWLFLPTHHIIWLSVDMDVYASLAGHPVVADKRLSFIGAWALRELLAFPIWALAICGNEVVWRGGKYQVLRAGEVKKAN
ncbi:glycosyltransferase family 21 protein [Serpula lacrymans var. lacrymans S7.3]|uniref:Ceramide glucosyltransferase n=2 Tax=Serpula lacrymans var. lacrymans TaxID=341189 RepID=F8PGP7_SERL3|nr:glycosyltransferase family 21 protein [Serpula lacrymans var. lacrymans S7.9]EGO04391.1 glycosyltransferase family 21 protein [Serpula lacrymans var. lacrymans S7.3]EGO30296.1 glycosyltransferase family 21 protein [Serpula lacrymans var. lacrymans S7.9]